VIFIDVRYPALSRRGIGNGNSVSAVASIVSQFSVLAQLTGAVARRGTGASGGLLIVPGADVIAACHNSSLKVQVLDR